LGSLHFVPNNKVPFHPADLLHIQFLRKLHPLMKPLEAITDDARHTTLDAALDELRREIKQRVGTPLKPGGAYNRWADAQPANLTKQRQYEQQTARMVAALKVLETLDEAAWARRLQAATTEPQTLFP
jgi:hypothetical protein